MLGGLRRWLRSTLLVSVARLLVGVVLIRCNEGCDWCSGQWGWETEKVVGLVFIEQKIGWVDSGYCFTGEEIVSWFHRWWCWAGGEWLGCSTVKGRPWRVVCWSLAVLVAGDMWLWLPASTIWCPEGRLVVFLFD